MAKILIKSAGTYEGRKQFRASIEGYDIVHGPHVTISQRWRIQKYGNQKGKRAGPDDEYEIIAKPALTVANKPKIHLGYSTLKAAKKIASDWLLTQPDYDEAEFERKMAEAMRGNPMKKKRLTPSVIASMLRTNGLGNTEKFELYEVFHPESSGRGNIVLWRGCASGAAHAKRKAKQASGRTTVGVAKKARALKNPSVGDYFHAAKRSASAAVRDVAAKAAAAAHAEAKRERKVTPEQALQTLAKSLGFSVVRGNPQKELRRYAVYRLGAHPTERPLWTGNATSGRHAQIQAERATGKDVGEARLMQGGSSLRRNGKFDKGVVDITHVEGVEYVAKYGNRVFNLAIVRHKDGGFMGIIMYDGGNRVYPTLKADTLAAIKEKIRRYILNLSESTYKLSGYANAVYGSNKKR